jgi:hypothetical protein
MRAITFSITHGGVDMRPPSVPRALLCRDFFPIFEWSQTLPSRFPQFYSELILTDCFGDDFRQRVHLLFARQRGRHMENSRFSTARTSWYALSISSIMLLVCSHSYIAPFLRCRVYFLSDLIISTYTHKGAYMVVACTFLRCTVYFVCLV